MIQVKQLYKKYGQEWLYEDFNLDIETQKITAILGSSGCGKTTLLRILAGIEPYESGSIEGINKNELSIVFQEDRLIPWLNVRENIEFVLSQAILNNKSYVQSLDDLIQLLQLKEVIDAPIQQLSGGMKRRVALARALAYPYNCLVLDEPFKGMDRTLKLKILKVLKEYWITHQKTVILITHDEEEANILSHWIYHLHGNPISYTVEKNIQ